MKEFAIVFAIVLNAFGSGVASAQAATSVPILETKPPYSLGCICDLLYNRGQTLIDIEQGQFSPTFDRLPQPNELSGGLSTFLGTKHYDCEMHGKALVIFDKDLRASSSKECPLNIKISSFHATNVTLKECFDQLGNTLKIKILGGTGIVVPRDMRTTFDINLDNITLREALFVIVASAKARAWSAAIFPMGNQKALSIIVQ